MSAERYRELRAEMPGRSRAFGFAIACLIDHAAAIKDYEQRLATEPDAEIQAIMAHAQVQEFRHFASDLEFLLQDNPEWRTACEDVIAKTRPSVAVVARGKER